METPGLPVGAHAVGIMALISFAMTSAASFELDMPVTQSGSAISSELEARAGFELSAEEFVQWGGVDIVVDGYSVPSFVNWNNDALPDLIVGEGGDGFPGRIRVYPNVGTLDEPEFDTYFFAQSGGGDLVVTPAGCLGAFPRVVYWDADSRKDLLVGVGDGRVMLFLNIGSDEDPVFDAGGFVQVGESGQKVDIDVGTRATSIVVDWNNDDRKDLVIGAYDGFLRLFLNEGTNTEPDFRTEALIQSNFQPLFVESFRSSPSVGDVTGDRKKDLVVGNTDGRLLLYENMGVDEDPEFYGFVAITSDGLPIDLPSSRSRPSLCNWNDDGRIDALIGSSDGTVRRYLNLGVFSDGFESGDTSEWSNSVP